MIKLSVCIIFIFNLFAQENISTFSIPSSNEINKYLFPPTQQCETCALKEKNPKKASDIYFSKFNCKHEGTTDEQYLKNWQLLGKSMEEYSETFKVPEIDTKYPSYNQEQIEKDFKEIFSMTGDYGVWLDCRLPKAVSFFKKNLKKFPDRVSHTCKCPPSKENILVNCGAKKDKVISSTLTIKEHESIGLWSTSLYHKINGSLRSNDHENVCSMMPIAKEIMNGIEKIPSFKGTVYRGGKIPQAFEALHIPGQVVEYPGFTSTSTSLKVATHFKSGDEGWLFTITLKKSCHDIQSISQGEEEILCPPGVKFKVISKDKQKKEIVLEEEI